MNFQKDHAPPGIYDDTCAIPKNPFVNVHESVSLPTLRFFGLRPLLMPDQ